MATRSSPDHNHIMYIIPPWSGPTQDTMSGEAKRHNFHGIKPHSHKFNCNSPDANINQFPLLKDQLPKGHDYHVCNYKTISQTDDHVNYNATFRMAMSSKDEVKEWLKSDTQTTWRVDRTEKVTGDRVIFKVEYRCQHNTKPKKGKDNMTPTASSRRSKNTNCPAKMSVTIYNIRTHISDNRLSGSTDPHFPAFPTMVRMCNDHNHNINTAEALRYRSGDASHKAVAALEEMYLDLKAMPHDSSWTAAVQAATKAFKKIKDNHSKVYTSLHMFGRFTNARMESVRAKALRRAPRHAGPKIDAQPTSVSRRSGGHTLRLGGKRRLSAGRPKKVTTGVDHTTNSQTRGPEC